MAMYDSLQLANQIKQHGIENLDRAVQAYEKDLFERIPAMYEGEDVLEMMLAEDAPRGFVEMMEGFGRE